MSKFQIVLPGFLILLFLPVLGQEASFVEYSNGRLILDNGIIHREISVNEKDNAITTTQFKISGDERNFIHGANPTEEFRLDVNGIALDGLAGWNFEGMDSGVEDSGGEFVILKLRAVESLPEVEVWVKYTLYPGLPVIRKKLTIINRGGETLKIENVDIETLALEPQPTGAEIYTDYGRHKHIGPYVGDWEDPVIPLHMPGSKRGIIMGNEAPGVLKRIAWYYNNRDFSAGLSHTDQPYPFRKWLEEGESFQTPQVFLVLYNRSESPNHALNFILPDYVRNHMGLEIFEKSYKPVFVYNTWNPFRKFINAGLIEELAQAANECGIREFVIDDGWQINQFTDKSADVPWWYTQVGDYLIDKDKFPDGLSPVFRDIKDKGMQPGLWLSIGSASNTAAVYRDHPEWFTEDMNGNPANLHTVGNETMFTACMSTGWTDHIRDVILELVDDHGLVYTKLDFASVTSAYVTDPAIAGCYAENHSNHRDQHESFMANYRGLFNLFDTLQKEAPDLFIDCTFETQGKMHLIDYAFMKHAEGNWLSNIEEDSPVGALRVRHLAWQRTPALPAASLVVGNLRLDSDDLEFDFFSLLGTFPIMLGDIREVTGENRAWLKKWSLWMEEMQEKYNYLSFRQDLGGFGEPAEGSWDGWQRINTETKSGGIAGVFRQGSAESKRLITLHGLEKENLYRVIDADSKEIKGEFTGAALQNKGFMVEFNKRYQGKIFEISKVN